MERSTSEPARGPDMIRISLRSKLVVSAANEIFLRDGSIINLTEKTKGSRLLLVPVTG